MQDAKKYISDFCNISTYQHFSTIVPQKKMPDLIRQFFITYVTPHQISLLPLLIHGYVLLLLLRLLTYVLHRSKS